MVRKYEGKTKQKSKPAKSTRTKQGKKLSHRVSSKVDESSASEHDYTLPDDYHYDSFDRLRTNEQP